MKLYVLFHHYEDDPAIMPGAAAVIDEYTIDNAGIEIWEDEKERAKNQMGPGSFREAILTVPDDFVTGLFEVPTRAVEAERLGDAEGS